MFQASKLFPKQSLLHKVILKWHIIYLSAKTKGASIQRYFHSGNICVGFVFVGSYMYVCIYAMYILMYLKQIYTLMLKLNNIQYWDIIEHYSSMSSIYNV